MIMGRSIVSAACLFLLSGTLISCSGGDGGISIGAGGEASAVSISSDNGDFSDDTGVVGDGGGSDTSVSGNIEDVVIDTGEDGGGGDGDADADEDKEIPTPSGPTFEDLMASSVDADAFGNVIDSAVSGLRYKSGDHYGITDSEGKYGYLQGESVEFFIGDISIGAAIEPAPRLTPYELANSNEHMAMNIARFLQTLDNDADPDNGIHINNAVHTLAEGTSLDFSNSAWPEISPNGLAPVAGEWVEKTTLELLVFELTSATEAGARELLSADSAMGHLSSTFLEIIFSLAEEAESLLSSSTCETDSQCKWTKLSRIPSYCSLGDKNLVYSEVNADLPAFELLEAQRVYLIDIREKLHRSVWGPDRTTGVCQTEFYPTWPICGESNHCEITTSSPGFLDLPPWEL